MPRSIKQIETEIANVKRQIVEKQEFQAIAQFAGSERLLALFNKTKDFYVDAMQRLDESAPALDREYAKHRACLALINGFIMGMTSAEAKIEELKKQFLDLNGELSTAMDEQTARDKRAM